jgi:hypothetical protein
MIRTFNQELRLANSGHGALKWIVGGNFERTVTDETSCCAFSTTPPTMPPTSTLTPARWTIIRASPTGRFSAMPNTG